MAPRLAAVLGAFGMGAVADRFIFDRTNARRRRHMARERGLAKLRRRSRAAVRRAKYTVGAEAEKRGHSTGGAPDVLHRARQASEPTRLGVPHASGDAGVSAGRREVPVGYGERNDGGPTAARGDSADGRDRSDRRDADHRSP
jgi:hypothetical protein